ncbi:RtcB family protein [Brevundimonas aurantiaca]|nr:RtcB family protein [Brevundimonas aurantiaca]
MQGAQTDTHLLGQRATADRPASSPQGVQKIEQAFGAGHDASLADLLTESGSIRFFGIRGCNYVSKEKHFGKDVFLTRKGAVSAKDGELGIIPGSMGAKSFIVRGKGNADSFCTCSHGAGRAMSRTEAKRRFTIEDHVRATEGVECRKDAEVIDETPMAYKDIDAVIAAQTDLIEVVHTLRQVVCVKG